MKNSRKNIKNDEVENKFKIKYIFYLIIGVIFALAIYSYAPADMSKTTDAKDMQNYIGIIGAWVSYGMFYLIGLASYLLSLLLLLWGGRSCITKPAFERKYYWTGMFLAIFGCSLLLAITPEAFIHIAEKLNLGSSDNPMRSIPGGAIGQYLVAPGVDEFKPGILRRLIGLVGSNILGWITLLSGLIIIYLSDWHAIVKKAIIDSAHNDYQKDLENQPEKKSLLRDAFDSLKQKQQQATQKKKEEQAAIAAMEQKSADTAPLMTTFFPENTVAENQLSAMQKLAQEPLEDEIKIDTPPHVTIDQNTLLNKSSSLGELNDATPNTDITVKGEKGKINKYGTYAYPNLNMLSKGDSSSGEDLVHINKCKLALQATLDAFKVQGRVTNHISGPRVTRYEITLEPGVKVEKVATLSGNIAMSLEAKSIRVLAPIPGKNAVGVEAPNAKSEAVFMRDVVESDIWQKSDAEIPIVLGKDIAGTPTILDLAKAPHLLIAGSTGSGKSVCMNTLIMSMLFKFSSDELRLIMVDPKVVELKDYETLPHLVTPVMNDSKKVPTALRWAVNEMERRYQILAQVGVKNLKGFNNRVITHPEYDLAGNEIPQKLPYLVIIIDELADLMMTEAKVDVEYSISRIAAKGRAAGLHIVVATQRPSTSVITGVIKANLPTRIAFRVGSQVDSRVILDKKGGESLLGKGDMLFLPPGGAELVRIQGAMVKDQDIKEIVKFISLQRPQEFDDGVLAEEIAEEVAEMVREGRTELDDAMDEIIADEYAPMVAKYSQAGDDELFRKALHIIFSSRQASTSYLQRRLKIGYGKAANLIDIMEERGIVGPQGPGGSKRQILVFDDIIEN